MAKITWKPGTLEAPLPPVMVTSSSGGKDNVFTAAWTGIINSEPPKTYVSIRPERFSHGLVSESGEFVINLPTEALIRAVDFVGVKSGRDMDKFEAAGLTKEPASAVGCPLIAESPVNLECRVFDVLHLGTHDMFLADIVAVDVDDAYIDEKGRFAMEKCGLAAYAHGTYFALGKKLGTFGFSVKKRKTARRGGTKK
ncbi:MAG: flavin reductase family protein [Clostridia bacterium]|nr:flavin reductase family protein [Clostridia bacterium]